MAQSVGVTTGIVSRLILKGKISQRGVISPEYKEIYEPTLKELEKEGIIMVEETNKMNTHRPKL